ncbi:hypothetical protein ACDA63_18735 [Uliginosibacterium sp. sgz301328]|uniref:hypothetical protein n=1 Tax=Uliginosibacterium sp. sgz301328 TaxID=3243764 RepID=UPI00359D2984
MVWFDKSFTPIRSSLAVAAFEGVPLGAMLVREESGAFSKMPNKYAFLNTDVIRMHNGTIDDISGNGEYAIGRWTNGLYYANTSPQTLTSADGIHYVVYQKLLLAADATNGRKLQCRLQNSTKPTSSNGVAAPGTVSGTVTLDTRTLAFSFTLNLAVGADSATIGPMTATLPASTTWWSLNSTMLGSDKTSVALLPIGTDSESPTLALGYTAQMPTVGYANGVAIFKCDQVVL